jgi:hypothetical protein
MEELENSEKNNETKGIIQKLHLEFNIFSALTLKIQQNQDHGLN